MIESADIVIVGGGAAGLTTAIFAAQAAEQTGASPRIVILDGARKLGAKILVAGGGRCNVTHDIVRPDDYNGPRPVVRNVLAAFDAGATVRWMEELGVTLKREPTGKLFPTTDDAHTVLDALLRRCESLGVTILTQHRVQEVRKLDDAGFEIVHSQGSLRAQGLVLATGGRSLPKTGSDGFGYELVRSLGHSVTPTFAALAPLVLQDTFFHRALSGIAHDVELSTFVDGKRLDRRAGSLLWTHFGISGPVAMDVSRFWIQAHAEGRRAELRVSLLPGASFERVERWLMDEAQRSPKRQVATVLADRLPARVAEAVAGEGGPIGHLSRDARRALVHRLTDLVLPVVTDRGWNYAEVTAGGVPMKEVDHRTMQSRRCPGLYLVGEILDVDGRIGGFNFQWAWATGHLAGRAVAATE